MSRIFSKRSLACPKICWISEVDGVRIKLPFLKKFENYLDDSKIHLIAAPGSGKTVLGVELISRLGKPALVLVPRLSIQRQWVDAIDSLFEAPPGNFPVVSRSVQTEAVITVITYQSLEALQKRWRGRSVADMGAQQGFVLVLDECHHMVGAWADTASKMIADGFFEKVVALTATPPFDASPVAWAKYQHVCGMQTMRFLVQSSYHTIVFAHIRTSFISVSLALGRCSD